MGDDEAGIDLAFADSLEQRPHVSVHVCLAGLIVSALLTTAPKGILSMNPP